MRKIRACSAWCEASPCFFSIIIWKFRKYFLSLHSDNEYEDMTNKNKHVLSQIRQVARRTAPKGSVVLLFGSRARGEARKSSDWDILIILPKDQVQQADYDQVSYPLVELGWKIGEQINPIVYTEQEWKANSITPFYDNVQRDAINLL